MKRYLLVLVGTGVTALLLSAHTIGTPAQASDEKIARVIHVDNRHPYASDENPATESLPLRTIGRAGRVALHNQKKGIGTKVVIHPGIYRETIRMESDGKTSDVPILFETKRKGAAIISGSDVWDQWTRQPGTKIYSRAWPYRWGLIAYPAGWKGKVRLEPIVRRREMAFVDGRLLDQVLSYRELKAGSFYVSEERRRIYLWPPEEVNIEEATVEVATRSDLFHARGVKNISLKGLIFQHDNNSIQGYAATFVGSSNVIVEDCRFLWNNWGGLVFHASQDIFVRNSEANHNGGIGMGAWKVRNLIMEGNQSSYNNWRGAKGGFTGWGVAGLKHLAMRNAVYRRHRAEGNQTRGFWLDSDNADILIEGARLCGNLTDGIFIEASQGPITLKDSIICRNRTGSGILSTNSSKVTLEGNVLYGNGAAQIRVTGKTKRTVPNRESGEKMVLEAKRWTIKDNVVVGNESSQILLEVAGWKHFLDSLRSDGNRWYKPGSAQGFRVGSGGMDLGKWQSTTGQDSNSTFSKPRFREAYDIQ